MSHAPLTDDTTADRPSRGRRMSPGATAVTAAIAAGSLALATYAASAGPGTTQDSTEALRSSVGQFSPTVAADAVAALSTTAATESNGLFAQLREMREEQARDAMGASASILDESVSTLRQQSEAISEQLAAEAAAEREAAEAAAAEAAEQARQAAEAAAEREAAEAAAAEATEQARQAAEAAAEQEAAAAEAAEQEAAAAQRAEQEAAARPATETTASRSAAREQAPAAAPAPAAPAPAAPEPAPAPAPVSSGNPRAIAQSMLGSYGWGQDQFGCLDSLWQKESNWDASATNPSSGAYGIPQSLPASKMASAGADWQTNPATQISWGLTYISGRYGSPCSAWAHSQANNWY